MTTSQASGSFDTQPQLFYPCIFYFRCKIPNVSLTYLHNYIFHHACTWCLSYPNAVLLLLMFKLYSCLLVCTVISHGFIYCSGFVALECVCEHRISKLSQNWMHLHTSARHSDRYHTRLWLRVFLHNLRIY